VVGIGAIVWAQQVLEIRVPASRDGPVFGVVGARPHGCRGAFGGRRCWQEVFDRREPFSARYFRVDVVRITSGHGRYRFGNAGWNGTVAPGGSQSFGFNVSGLATPTNCTGVPLIDIFFPIAPRSAPS